MHNRLRRARNSLRNHLHLFSLAFSSISRLLYISEGVAQKREMRRVKENAQERETVPKWRRQSKTRIYINNKHRDKQQQQEQQTKRSWAKKSIAMVTIWRNLFLISREAATRNKTRPKTTINNQIWVYCQMLFVCPEKPNRIWDSFEHKQCIGVVKIPSIKYCYT